MSPRGGRRGCTTREERSRSRGCEQSLRRRLLGLRFRRKRIGEDDVVQFERYDRAHGPRAGPSLAFGLARSDAVEPDVIRVETPLY